MKQRTFDINSNDNTLFVTEQCNNHCIMCCQPPSKADDIEALYEQNIQRIHEAPKDLPVLGITGGEPTLLGDKLISLVEEIRKCLPNTEIHILSNGRNFSDKHYAASLAEVGDGKLVMGIPLHSDYGRDHDMIAGAVGAYKETMEGLYNLGALNVCIELRIVMNRLNYHRFLPMAHFIHKNLSFVGWTAFMGMELIGYAVKHYKSIWIEPKEYIPQLTAAVKYLADWNSYVSIYNIPLCLLPEEMYPFAQKSISDWKNNYLGFCDGCSMKDKCCGLFTTSKEPFKGLHPILSNDVI